MAEKSHGMTFSWSTDNGSTDELVGELVDITVPSISKETIETTNHNSAGVRTFMGGLIDFGECSITVNYDVDDAVGGSSTSNHEGLRDLAATAFETAGTGGDTKVFIITFPDGSSTMTFGGIVTGFELSTPIDDVVKATYTIKVSGSVNYA